MCQSFMFHKSRRIINILKFKKGKEKNAEILKTNVLGLLISRLNLLTLIYVQISPRLFHDEFRI